MKCSGALEPDKLPSTVWTSLPTNESEEEEEEEESGNEVTTVAL
jgi:hypothetical protein